MGVKTNTAAIIAVGEQIGSLGGAKEQMRPIFDHLQNYGERRNYALMFACNKFNFNNFYPTHDMIFLGTYDGEGAYQAFYKFNETGEAQSLVDRLNECGVKIDTSIADNVQQMFWYANVTDAPELDMRACIKNRWSTTGVFSRSAIKKVKIIVSEETFFSDYTFQATYEIEDLEIVGTIAGGTGLNMKDLTKLNKNSFISLINALSPDVAPYPLTVSKSAVKKAFETTPGANDGDTSPAWITLTNSKPHWTITLA